MSQPVIVRQGARQPKRKKQDQKMLRIGMIRGAVIATAAVVLPAALMLSGLQATFYLLPTAAMLAILVALCVYK